MVLIISKKGTVTGKELAEHFEVSLRTIYRDICPISAWKKNCGSTCF
ncbi:HTH domain-containing protein [Brevibacillus borstelensis]|nr:HTH domain-containing protein [Brevibacillus borstelensis]MCC0563807.1 HTH domain-containing protein [Brevibacillus borstelensis]MCM3472074.1 HTH domain-containing protein [Brevibacillus borstelensis]MCM3560122.1 HTH domain-containing protein [Brevibacillus borstelensis]MCM3592292.1 HTH domain-containing protein [Brevibacillus borstelensis]MCM3623739.1 HTH domain-containing protein [Brevibacillus borstelensis]